MWSKGLIVYKKDSKRITYIEYPINFNNKSRLHTIYESQEAIKKIQLIYDFDEKCKLYIVDEPKFLKIGSLESIRGRKKINIIKEYYVSKDFTGESHFTIKEDMIYEELDGLMLQNRYTKNKDISTKFTLEITNEKALYSPICSFNTIMFITQSQENTEIRKAIVTPLFAYPLYSIIDKDITTEIKAEFFFYSKSLKQEFAVFIRLNNYDKCVVFDFYRSTGEYVFTKRHSILGVTTNDSSKLNVQVSPNGRFIAFIFTTDPAKKGSTIGKVTRNSATKIRRLGSQKSVRSKISDMNEGGSSSFEEAKDSSNSIFQEHTSPFRKLRESKTKNITFKFESK